MATKRLEVLITGNAKDAQKAFGALGDSAEKGGKRTTKALSGIQSGLVGLGVGAAALGSFKAFEESERISRQTAAVIKSTGNEANVTEGHISDLASEMSKLGGVDDELVQQGENMLLTFTKVRNEAGKGNDVFDQATRAANDYAAATGTDVVNANKMLGKALNDPIKGLTALTRAGVSFTQQQKDQIRALVDAGDTLGAQKIILAEFNKEYGGSLEANATASGKAQVAMENLGEAAGGILAPGLELLASGATAAAEGLAGLPTGAQQAIIGVTGLGTAAVIAGPKVAEMVGTVRDGAKALSGFASKSATVGKATSAIGGAVDAIGGVSTVAPVAATGLGILAAGFIKSQIEAERTKQDVGDLLSMIQDGMSPTEAAAEKLNRTLSGVEGGFSGLMGSSKDMRNDLRELGYTTADTAKLIALPADEWKKMRAEILKNKVGDEPQDIYNLVDNLDLMREKMREAGQQDKELEANSKALAQAGFGAVTEAAGTTATALSESFAATGDQARAAGDLTSKIMEQVDATSLLNDEMRTHIDLAHESVGAALSEREAHDRVQDATVALAEARRTNDPEQIQRAQDDLTRAILGEATAADEAARKSAELQGKQYGAAESATVQQARLAQLQAQTGFTSDEIQWLSVQLDNAARERQISIDTSQAISNVRGLIGALEDLSAVGRTVGAAGSIIDVGVSGAIATVGAKANGGAFKKGDWDWVGENGPELVNWGGNGVVIPANKSKQLVNTIREDEPGWDWRTMGNRRRGPVSTPRQTLDFRTGTTVNPGNPGPSSGSFGGGAPITVNVFESKNARATAREVVAEIRRESRMGGSPLAGVRL